MAMYLIKPQYKSRGQVTTATSTIENTWTGSYTTQRWGGMAFTDSALKVTTGVASSVLYSTSLTRKTYTMSTWKVTNPITYSLATADKITMMMKAANNSGTLDYDIAPNTITWNCNYIKVFTTYINPVETTIILNSKTSYKASNYTYYNSRQRSSSTLMYTARGTYYYSIPGGTTSFENGVNYTTSSTMYLAPDYTRTITATIQRSVKSFDFNFTAQITNTLSATGTFYSFTTSKTVSYKLSTVTAGSRLSTSTTGGSGISGGAQNHTYQMFYTASETVTYCSTTTNTYTTTTEVT